MLILLFTSACGKRGDSRAEAATLAGPNCAIPGNIERPDPEIPDEREVARIPVHGYTLALSWSPQFCRDRGESPNHATQCAGVRPFGFVLHGLWPEGEGRKHPAWCAPADLLTVPQIRANFCMMPSAQLQQHEWAKHGTCQWRTPEAFFAAGAKAFHSIKMPDMDALSRAEISIDAFRTSLAQLNPGLQANTIDVRTKRGNWLSEVHICLDSAMKPKPCAQMSGKRSRQNLKIWRPVK